MITVQDPIKGFREVDFDLFIKLESITDTKPFREFTVTVFLPEGQHPRDLENPCLQYYRGWHPDDSRKSLELVPIFTEIADRERFGNGDWGYREFMSPARWVDMKSLRMTIWMEQEQNSVRFMTYDD